MSPQVRRYDLAERRASRRLGLALYLSRVCAGEVSGVICDPAVGSGGIDLLADVAAARAFFDEPQGLIQATVDGSYRLPCCGFRPESVRHPPRLSPEMIVLRAPRHEISGSDEVMRCARLSPAEMNL